MNASEQGTMYMHAARQGDIHHRCKMDPNVEFHAPEDNDQSVLKDICDYLAETLGVKMVNCVPISGNRMYVIEEMRPGASYHGAVWMQVRHYDDEHPDGYWLVMRELGELVPCNVTLSPRREKTPHGPLRAGFQVTLSSGRLAYTQAADDMIRMIECATNTVTYIESGEYKLAVDTANSIKASREVRA